jgi:hypothetical protein
MHASQAPPEPQRPLASSPDIEQLRARPAAGILFHFTLATVALAQIEALCNAGGTPSEPAEHPAPPASSPDIEQQLVPPVSDFWFFCSVGTIALAEIGALCAWLAP